MMGKPTRQRKTIPNKHSGVVRELVMEYPKRAYRLVKTVRNWYDLIFFHVSLKREVIFHLRNGLKFVYVPGLFNFEVFLDEPYKCVDVKGKLVIDVGAFNGDSAIYFAIKGAKVVYGFEPYPLACSTARKNLHLNAKTISYYTTRGWVRQSPTLLSIRIM